MPRSNSRTKRTLPVFIGQVDRQKHQLDDQQPYTQYQTWLAETSGMLGCPINCQYCFFQLDGYTPVQPEVGLTPREIVDKLGEQPTYMPEMPVHYGSKTDAFSTKRTIDYYAQVLQYYGESNYPNPLVFITKRSIPDEIMALALSIKQPVFFYLSFSGLGGTAIEPTVDSEVIKDNFVRLKAKELFAVHYWRPFLPQNSTQEKTLKQALKPG